MTDGTKALVERLRERAHAARDEKTATGICDALHFEEAADAIERLARERDEALAVIAAADKGSPIYKAVERILDDQSAWIVRPNADVTKAIALAAGVAWMAAEKIDPGLDEMDRSLSEARAALAAVQAENAKLRDVPDYFGTLAERARAAAIKASAKSPQPNYVTLKIAEEAGEVVRAAVHYAEGRMEWSEVEGEIIQLLAMLIRLVTEGDQINGVLPPSAALNGDRADG